MVTTTMPPQVGPLVEPTTEKSDRAIERVDPWSGAVRLRIEPRPEDRSETMIANTGGASVGSGEDGLINALRRERTRYHERQSALLARVLCGKSKPGTR